MDTEFRKPTVAGLFYPSETDNLSKLITDLLNQKPPVSFTKMLIVPHAAYQYIGEILAQSYLHLFSRSQQIKTVVLLTPSHHIKFNGIAITSKDCYLTPFGEVIIDSDAMMTLLNFPQVVMFDDAHIKEHSIEIHLPFLQTILPSFSLVPLIIGETNSYNILEILEKLWEQEETLIIASMNLSHYQTYNIAQELDQRTSQAIESLHWQSLQTNQICNIHLISSLLQLAHQKSLTPKTIKVCNSGDLTGIKNRVVGYGAFIFQ